MMGKELEDWSNLFPLFWGLLTMCSKGENSDIQLGGLSGGSLTAGS
jgi:hypothetical protein